MELGLDQLAASKKIEPEHTSAPVLCVYDLNRKHKIMIGVKRFVIRGALQEAKGYLLNMPPANTEYIKDRSEQLDKGQPATSLRSRDKVISPSRG